MPVVVNEFEVVNESPQGAPAAVPDSPPSAPPTIDIDAALSAQRARARRVRAY